MLKVTLNNGATFTNVLEVKFIKQGKEVSLLLDDYSTQPVFTQNIDTIMELI